MSIKNRGKAGLVFKSKFRKQAYIISHCNSKIIYNDYDFFGEPFYWYSNNWGWADEADRPDSALFTKNSFEILNLTQEEKNLSAKY